MPPKRWKPEWVSYPMAELEHFLETSASDPDDLQGHGVYFLRRRLVPYNAHTRDPIRFAAYLERQLNLGNGRIDIPVGKHYVKGEIALQLGVSDLTAAQQESIDTATWAPADRRTIVKALQSAPGPVLYCGETSHFITRVKQHLNGSIVWKKLLAAGFTPEDINFEALPFPAVDDPASPQATRLRRTVERILAQLTTAPFTSRPG